MGNKYLEKIALNKYEQYLKDNPEPRPGTLRRGTIASNHSGMLAISGHLENLANKTKIPESKAMFKAEQQRGVQTVRFSNIAKDPLLQAKADRPGLLAGVRKARGTAIVGPVQTSKLMGLARVLSKR